MIAVTSPILQSTSAVTKKPLVHHHAPPMYIAVEERENGRVTVEKREREREREIVIFFSFVQSVNLETAYLVEIENFLLKVL